MRKKELLLEIEKLQERVKHLEACIKTQDRLLEGYQQREHAVVHAMQQVQTDVEKRLAEADEKARRIEAQAKQESSRLLAQTEATAAEYRDAIERYNAALEYAAAEAAANAERFASFARGRKLSEADIVRETDGLSQIPFHDRVTELPDPNGDPAQLMRNIYRIQNRTVPEGTLEETGAQNEQSGAHEAANNQAHDCSEEEIMIDALVEESFFADEDTAEIPTVNGVLEQCALETDNVQELSLDDLLDEIIKSGEQYHG